LLRENFFNTEEMAAIACDFRTSGLKSVELDVMALAEKVTLNANSVTQEDVDGLREHGLTDEEIMDVVLAAALRNFFSKILDALGAEPDETYHELEPELIDALAIGRPFE
jgi:alkylhydroperoxidase family enzyme